MPLGGRPEMAGKKDPTQFPTAEVEMVGGLEIRRAKADTADGFRELFKRGREQYGTTNADIAFSLGWDERTVTNLLTHGRPLKYRKAKDLLRALIDSDAAVEWRKKHGCRPEHRTGSPIWCASSPPCDRWYAELRSVYQFGSWLIPDRRREPPVIIPPAALEDFAHNLAAGISATPGAKLRSKRDVIEKAIVSYLRQHGARMAFECSWDLSSRARILIGNAEGDRVKLLYQRGEAGEHEPLSAEQRAKDAFNLLEMPRADMAAGVINIVVGMQWPAEQWVKKEDLNRKIDFLDTVRTR
jgi:hypothetical protein